MSEQNEAKQGMTPNPQRELCEKGLDRLLTTQAEPSKPVSSTEPPAGADISDK